MRLGILILSAAGLLVAQDRQPTPEDVELTIKEWQRLTAPGQILRADAGTVVLLNPQDYRKIEDGKKIGDEEGVIAELIAAKRAFKLEKETEVRMLDKTDDSCIAMVSLGLRCTGDDAAGLRNAYKRTFVDPQPAPRPIGSPLAAKDPANDPQLIAQRRARLHDMFVKHDVAMLIEHGYALVRVVDQPSLKGYVRMTELQSSR